MDQEQALFRFKCNLYKHLPAIPVPIFGHEELELMVNSIFYLEKTKGHSWVTSHSEYSPDYRLEQAYEYIDFMIQC